MAEKLNAQAVAEMRAFNQSWNIGNHEAAEIRQLHDPEIRFQRSERVIGNLRTRCGDARDKRRLTGVREPDEPDICEQLQLEPQPPFLSRAARLMFRWRLMGRRGKTCVPASAASAARNDETLACLSKIVQLLARGFVVDNRPNRNLDLDRFSFGPGAIAAFAVAAALRLVLGVEAEFEEGILVLVSDKRYVAATAAIPSAWAATRDVFFASKSQAPVTAVSGLNQDANLIDERAMGLLARRDSSSHAARTRKFSAEFIPPR
jgi:hypothetical protein